MKNQRVSIQGPHTAKGRAGNAKRLLVLAMACFVTMVANAQSDKQQSQAAAGHAGIKGSHRITLGLGHTHVSQGIFEGKRMAYVGILVHQL